MKPFFMSIPIDVSAELRAPGEIGPGVKLITGEIGKIDDGFRFTTRPGAQPRKTMTGNDKIPQTIFDESIGRAIAQQRLEAAQAAKVAAVVSLEEMGALAREGLESASDHLNELVRSVFQFVSRRNDETMNAIAPDDAKEEELQAIEDKITIAWNKLEEATPERWVIIATQHLQQGLMALRRAIDAPTEF